MQKSDNIRIGRRTAVVLALLIALPGTLTAQEAELAAPRSARSLDFYVCEHGITVDVFDAWPGAAPLSYTLVRHDDPVPATPAGQVLRVPVRRIVSLATPVLAHLSDLEAADRVVAVDTEDYIYDAELRRRVEQGEIAELGAGGQLDLERLIALEPDVVLMSVYGPDDPGLARIRAAGIPVVVFADWREQNPLARSEWLRLIGLLVERDRVAQRLVAQRRQSYEDLRDRVAASLRARPSTDRPTIMANAPWQGSWPMPRGESYMAQLFADAGGRYLWANTPGAGSVFLDLEAVLARASDADVWINGNVGWRSLADVRATDARLTAFAPFRSGEIYHHNRRVRDSGANDFWESGATRPDLLLADLVGILHPELVPGHQPVYYRRLTR